MMAAVVFFVPPGHLYHAKDFVLGSLTQLFGLGPFKAKFVLQKIL